MITYLYSLKYPQTRRVPSSLAEDLILDAKMYALADKYDLPVLKKQIKRAFDELLNSAKYKTAFASSRLYCKVMAGIARFVYESTPESDRGLRDIVKEYTTGRRTLFADKDFQKCILETQGYMVDVIQSLFEDAESGDSFVLPQKKKARMC